MQAYYPYMAESGGKVELGNIYQNSIGRYHKICPVCLENNTQNQALDEYHLIFVCQALRLQRKTLKIENFQMSEENKSLNKDQLLKKFVGDQNIPINQLMKRGRAIAVLKATWFSLQ